MKKLSWLLIVLVIINCISLITGSYAGEVKSKSKSVLQTIETYQAPPFPKSDQINKETYDYRKEYGVAVPPTLIDAFVADLWQIMKEDLKINGITIYRVSVDHVIQALNIYLHRDWKNIAGYRPWTHWHFVRSLSPEKRKILAQEVVRYMYDNGVKEGL
jgi:hypothetical protein